MSNQIYSVPYGTVQLHDPSQYPTSAGLINARYGSRNDSNSNSNSGSGRGSVSVSLAGSPTPSSGEDDQDDSADYSTRGSSNNRSTKGTLKPRGKRATSKTPTIAKKAAAAAGVGPKRAPGGSKKKSALAANPLSGGMSEHDELTGRRKIRIQFVEDDNRRHVTFSKRKAGIMKKAYELATLTGTQVLLLIVSQSDQVFTFATPKLQPIVMESEGQELIQSCLQAPEAESYVGGEEDDHMIKAEEGENEEEEEQQGAAGREDPNFEREEGLDTAEDAEAEEEPELDLLQDDATGPQEKQDQLEQVPVPQSIPSTNGKRGSTPFKTSTPAHGNSRSSGGRVKKAKAQSHPQSLAQQCPANEEQCDESEQRLPPAFIPKSQTPADEEEQKRPNKRSRDQMTSDSFVTLSSDPIHGSANGNGSVSVLLPSPYGTTSGDQINMNMGLGGSLNQYWNGRNDNRVIFGGDHYHSSYSHLSNINDHSIHDSNMGHPNYHSSAIPHDRHWNHGGDGDYQFRENGLSNVLKQDSSVSTMFSGSTSAGGHANPYRSQGSGVATNSVAYEAGWGA